MMFAYDFGRGCLCTVLLDYYKHQGHMAVTQGHRYWLLALAVGWLPSTVEMGNLLFG